MKALSRMINITLLTPLIQPKSTLQTFSFCSNMLSSFVLTLKTPPIGMEVHLFSAKEWTSQPNLLGSGSLQCGSDVNSATCT
jgi:hypothetical protein